MRRLRCNVRVLVAFCCLSFLQLLNAATTTTTTTTASASALPTCTFESCPVCLPDAKNASKNLDVYAFGKLQSLPLRLGRCLEYWDTQALTSQFVGILAREKIGINVEYVHAEDEGVFFMSVNNCQNWKNKECKKVVRSEAEAAAAHIAGQKLYADAAPDMMWTPELAMEDCCVESLFTETDIVWLAKEVRTLNSVGFIALTGFYILPEIADKAWKQDGVELQFWRAFTSSNVSKYFPTVKSLQDSGKIVLENPGCTGGDASAIAGKAALTKSGWSCIDGWWLTPACAALGSKWKMECVPLLDDSWGFFKPDVFASMAAYGMKFAKVVLGYDLYYELIYYKVFTAPFCWWFPDSQFTVHNPLSVRLPGKTEKKMYSSCSTIAWSPVLDANEQLSYLLHNIEVSNSEAEQLMAAVAKAQLQDYWSGVDTGPALYQKLACDFLRNNSEVWKKWLPDPRNCALGSFYNTSKLLCEPCATGTHSYRDPLDGIPQCLSCPPGTYCPKQSPAPIQCALGHFAASSGLGECTACSRGTYQNQTGQTKCYSCERFMTTLPDSTRSTADDCACALGTYASGQRCVSCPQNSTTINLASKSPSACRCAEDMYMSDDLKTCIKCPVGSETEGVGKTHISSCLCEKGTYLPTGAAACASCPEGFSCPVGSSAANFATKKARRALAALPKSPESAFPLLKVGYWAAFSDPLKVYMCGSVPSPRCAGGVSESCNGGHSAFICNDCGVGYISAGSQCSKCAFWQSIVPILVLIALVIAANQVYWFCNGPISTRVSDRLRVSILFSMIITNVQVLGTLNQLNIPWPAQVEDGFESASVLLFKPKTMAAECTVGHDPSVLYAVRFSMPFLVILSFVLLFVVYKVLGAIVKSDWAWGFDKTVNSICVLLQSVFIALCGFVSVPLQCYTHPNGEKSISQYPSVICGTDAWVPLMAMAVIMLISIILPYVATCIWAVRMLARDPLKAYVICTRHRSLFYRFRPDVSWWGLAFLLRQTLLAFAPTLYPDDPITQVIYVVYVLVVYIAVLCYFAPWKSRMLTMFDMISAVLLLLVVVTSASFIPISDRGQVHSEALFFLVILLMGTGGALFVVAVAMVARQHFGMTAKPDDTAIRRLSEDLRRFNRFWSAVPDEDMFTILQRMNNFDRTTLQDSINVVQAAIGSQFKVTDSADFRLTARVSVTNGANIATLKPEVRTSLNGLQPMPSLVLEKSASVETAALEDNGDDSASTRSVAGDVADESAKEGFQNVVATSLSKEMITPRAGGHAPHEEDIVDM